jgi:RHS repeat-associated protein
MATTTNYIWDDDAVLMETDETGATTATYTREPDQFGSLISQHRGGQTHVHHYDALGSTTELTDSAETVTDTFRYSAFGNEVNRTGTTQTPHTWVGKSGYQRDEPKRFYVRRRHLLSDECRWMTLDPSGFLDGPNRFSYVANQPIDLTDPTGLLRDGAFEFTSKKCHPAEGYTECCCSSFQVKFTPTNVQQTRYLRVKLRVWVRSRRTFTVCPILWRDTGWHHDDPGNTKGGRTDWVPARAGLPAIWDDWPGAGPDAGPVGVLGLCPPCRLTSLKQEYEVCAIGLRRGIGGRSEQMGCVRYQHDCTLTYTILPIFPLGPVTCGQCIASCKINRTPTDRAVAPSAPVDSPFDTTPW